MATIYSYSRSKKARPPQPWSCERNKEWWSVIGPQLVKKKLDEVSPLCKDNSSVYWRECVENARRMLDDYKENYKAQEMQWWYDFHTVPPFAYSLTENPWNAIDNLGSLYLSGGYSKMVEECFRKMAKLRAARLSIASVCQESP